MHRCTDKTSGPARTDGQQHPHPGMHTGIDTHNNRNTRCRHPSIHPSIHPLAHPPECIISTAQQASPKVIGHRDPLRAQFTRSSTLDTTNSVGVVWFVRWFEGE